jgi:predicted glycoside hydrolase/deacetylase ChbG (UPF0249 family)
MPLILNADDFGLTPGVNRAILELFHAGVLTSTTLMATAPAADDAIALALANPGLGVGCHLNFVEGDPAAHPEAIPSLLGADGKTFRPSILDFTQALLRGKIEPAELALETQSQIQRLQRAGLDVTHVDTHKHTHVFPLIARTIAHIAQRCGIHAIRNPYEPRWSSRLAPASLPRRAFLELFRLSERSFRALPQLGSRELLTPDGTLGIAGTGIMTADILRGTLAAMPPEGTFELCCHPGHRDAALDAAPTRLRASREAEFRMLLEVVPEFSRTNPGVELIHYGNLGIAGLQRASGQFQPHTGFEKVL